MLPGIINANENWALHLLRCRVKSTYDSSRSSASLTARKAVFVVEKRVDWSTDLKCHLDPAAWVFPGKINVMENCARFNWGLTTLSGEVNVRFIVLLSRFNDTQGRVRG